MVAVSEIPKPEADRPITVALLRAIADVKGLTALVLDITAFLGAVYALERGFGVQRPWSIILSFVPFFGFGLLYVLPAWMQAAALRRRRELGIKGVISYPEYFRLTPYSSLDKAQFSRADGVDVKTTEWIQNSKAAILYLFGQSGVGKSSLLTASVIPALEQLDTPWIVINFRLGTNPSEELKAVLLKPNMLWRNPPKIGSEFVEIVLDRAVRHARELGRRILLVIDQFEEFFILLDEETRLSICGLFQQILAAPPEGLTIILSLRADTTSITA